MLIFNILHLHMHIMHIYLFDIHISLKIKQVNDKFVLLYF